MNPVTIHGMGAVSPAGWGVPALRQALEQQSPIPTQPIEGPRPFRARMVPPPTKRPAVLKHARLRRSSPISQFAAAAAMEALCDIPCPPDELGIVFSTMCGSVRYTRRFYAEALENPATASPILFPETVFNAPASHVAAATGASVPAYTLVGDSSIFLQALALGAQWVASGFVQCSLVIAAEETDWTVLEGWRAFTRGTVLAEGAAAVCLSCEPASGAGIALASITDPIPFSTTVSPLSATRRLRDQMNSLEPGELLCDGRSGEAQTEALETDVWSSWPGPRISPKTILGEGMAAAVGWQCIAALDRLQSRTSPAVAAARVTAVGCNHQAIAAHFKATKPTAHDPPRRV